MVLETIVEVTTGPKLDKAQLRKILSLIQNDGLNV